MKIMCNSSVSFTSGKVNVYSDFDGTYFPVKKDELANKNSFDFLNNYCNETKDLLDNTKGDLSFTITTGRRFEKYKKIIEYLRDKNINLPLPEFLVTGNGSYSYKKKCSDDDFFQYSKQPFDETSVIQNKEERLNELRKVHKHRDLNKVFDTKISVQNAIKNNDLVIIIGDGSNDFDMLNPLNYIDMKKYKEKSNIKEFFTQSTHKKLEDIMAVYSNNNSVYINKLRNEFISNGLLKEIENLPLYCIVINRHDEHKDLVPIVDAFSKSGKVQYMERGDWNKKIKSLIKEYANKSNEFRHGMSEKFKNYIFGNKIPTTNKTASKLPVVLLISSIIAVITALVYKNSRKKM